MDNKTLYISLEQSVMVFNKNVHIDDIAKVFCTDMDIKHGVEKTKLFSFDSRSANQKVITIMKIIEEVSLVYKDLSIVNIGSPETVVYFKPKHSENKTASRIKLILLLLIAFFGTAYSIMSYNSDVGSRDLFDKLYYEFVPNGLMSDKVLKITSTIIYSGGLCIGMIIFFNHGFQKYSKKDPTPLQVQMRVYENDVNKCIIVNESRHKETIDVD